MSTSAPVISRRALTIGMCTAVVAIAFESIAVATALPAAASELNGLRYYAWAFSTLQVGTLLATVATGRLADRIGPARPMLVGMAVFCVGLVVAATSATMLQLIVGRFVQGLGSGTMGVAVSVCIARVFEPRERPRMFSYISMAWMLPAFFGPPVSAWLTAQLGWPWVFWAVLPLVAFAAVMVGPSLRTMMQLPDPISGTAGSRPPAAMWAAALAAAAVVSLQIAGQRLDWLSLPLLVAGVTLLLVSLPNLMPVGFFRFGAGLPSVVVVRGLIAGAFFGAEAFIPLMLVEQRGLSLVLGGVVLTVGSIGWTTGSWLQSRPGLRLRRDRIITVGASLVALGLSVAVLTAGVASVWVGLIGVSWVLAGLGMGLAFSSTSVAAMSLSPAAEQGRNSSSLALGEALGGSLLVGLSGSIFASLHPSGQLPITFGSVMAAMCLLAALGALLSLRIGRLPNELSA
ncbi:MAG TPA: MFS transporter [Propionibacteriaceae bacterium]|nr:MFS transporter [Propionibacteriaceae bacterium]